MSNAAYGNHDDPPPGGSQPARVSTPKPGDDAPPSGERHAATPGEGATAKPRPDDEADPGVG